MHERTNGLTEQKSSINKRFIRTIFELENERKRRQTNEFKILPKDWKKHERNRSFIWTVNKRIKKKNAPISMMQRETFCSRRKVLKMNRKFRKQIGKKHLNQLCYTKISINYNIKPTYISGKVLRCPIGLHIQLGKSA